MASWIPAQYYEPGRYFSRHNCVPQRVVKSMRMQWWTVYRRKPLDLSHWHHWNTTTCSNWLTSSTFDVAVGKLGVAIWKKAFEEVASSATDICPKITVRYPFEHEKPLHERCRRPFLRDEIGAKSELVEAYPPNFFTPLKSHIWSYANPHELWKWVT